MVLTRGREGVKNPKILADVICERPLMPTSLLKSARSSVRSEGGRAGRLRIECGLDCDSPTAALQDRWMDGMDGRCGLGKIAPHREPDK